MTFLETWYEAHCDGEFEHDQRVRISTIDNPGWMLTVNLDDTDLAGKLLAMRRTEVSDQEWTIVRCDGHEFFAAGGTGALEDLFDAFESFARSESQVD